MINNPAIDPSFAYNFPSIRGIQAGREFYISMCPLRLIPRIFIFDEKELPPEVRAQRTLNRSRVPEMARYILGNPEDYVFSALTASIDAEVKFIPVSLETDNQRMGTLLIPMSAKFILNDGQHRRAAITQALEENPELGDESIAIVLFLDLGLERCQQMFADLNRYAIRPSRSLGVLYDHRDDKAKLAKLVVLESEIFRDMVELERSSLSHRSRKLFTLSALYYANTHLIEGIATGDFVKDANTVRIYWENIAKFIPEWQQVRERKISAGEVRRDFIHCHAITLQALGKVGNSLMNNGNKSWKKELHKIRDIDWSRSNPIWEGRAMSGGNLTNTGQKITLTANYIKAKLGFSLTPEEERVELAFTGKK